MTGRGRAYAGLLIHSLNRVEEKAIELMGEERICAMTELVREFDFALNTALKEND